MRQGIFFKKWFDDCSFKRRWKYSFRERNWFMILVITISRESMQDFRSFVGIRSSEHVAFEEERIALRTSMVVAGKKSERGGGALEGGGLRFRTIAGVRGVNLAQRFVILSSKNCRKAEAMEWANALHSQVGLCQQAAYSAVAVTYLSQGFSFSSCIYDA